MIKIPDLAQPKAVGKAAAVVQAREGDVASARQAVEEAKASIQQAVIADRQAYADALDRGQGDPGKAAEDQARDHLAECERLLATEELRQQRARDGLDQVLAETLPAWTAAATKAAQEAEQEALRLIDQLGEAVEQRTVRRVTLAWLRARAQGGKLPSLDFVPGTPSTVVRNPQAGPETIPVAELLASIRVGIERVSLHGEQARHVEREQAPALHVA